MYKSTPKVGSVFWYSFGSTDPDMFVCMFVYSYFLKNAESIQYTHLCARGGGGGNV
jgi:hypothetical protein